MISWADFWKEKDVHARRKNQVWAGSFIHFQLPHPLEHSPQLGQRFWQ
jgi:hypothetical protein